MDDQTLFISARHFNIARTLAVVDLDTLPPEPFVFSRFLVYAYLSYFRAEKERRERLLFEEAERLADQHVTVNKNYIFSLHLLCIRR